MSAPTFTDSMPLSRARAALRELVYDGHACPCCTQFAKVYRRNLNAGMARTLIALYRAGGAEGWVHAPSVLGAGHHGGDCGKLRYWELVREAPETRRDDGGRAGYWRVTETGAAFVRREVSVPRYALVYDGRCLGIEGEPVTVGDALGDRFDYAELMGRT